MAHHPFLTVDLHKRQCPEKVMNPPVVRNNSLESIIIHTVCATLTHTPIFFRKSRLSDLSDLMISHSLRHISLASSMKSDIETGETRLRFFSGSIFVFFNRYMIVDIRLNNSDFWLSKISAVLFISTGTVPYRNTLINSSNTIYLILSN